LSKDLIKLPPNQQLAAPGKWPLVGERAPDPARGDEPWRVSVSGLVARPQAWSLDQLRALPQEERVVDIHCVTRWSKPGARFRGVPLRTLLDACDPRPEAKYLSFAARSARGHSTSLPLEDALALDALIALEYEGKPLPEEHGGPVRTVVPGRYFYKSLKWLEEIELLTEDRLGYWEKEAGYHNGADPWAEERYVVPELDNVQYRQVLQKRDFSGRDLLGIRAEGRDLAGLNAAEAKLRDAHFERAGLRGASFERANLSNAHLQGADLRDASFRDADCEGADFRGADLRGADFAGCSLFGASVVNEDGTNPARLDTSTRIDSDAIGQLTPPQQRFVQRNLTNGS